LTFSGLCHDVNHTGRTNAFEIASLSTLAMRYHDESVNKEFKKKLKKKSDLNLEFFIFILNLLLFFFQITP
jgi:hypothetical protein